MFVIIRRRRRISHLRKCSTKISQQSFHCHFYTGTNLFEPSTMPDCRRKLYQYLYSGNSIILREPCLRMDCKTCILNLNRRSLRDIVSPTLLDHTYERNSRGEILMKRQLISREQLSDGKWHRAVVAESEEHEKARQHKRIQKFRKRMVLKFREKRPEFADMVRNRHIGAGGGHVRVQFHARKACFVALVSRLNREITELQLGKELSDREIPALRR